MALVWAYIEYKNGDDETVIVLANQTFTSRSAAQSHANTIKTQNKVWIEPLQMTEEELEIEKGLITDRLNEIL